MKSLFERFLSLFRKKVSPSGKIELPAESPCSVRQLQDAIRTSWKCAVCRKPVLSDYLYSPAIRDDRHFQPQKFLCPKCLITKELTHKILNIKSRWKPKKNRIPKDKRGKEYGWAVGVKIEEVREGLKGVIRGIHQKAIFSLWKGAVYEVGITPTKDAAILVYYYYAPGMRMDDHVRAIPKKRWPEEAIADDWIFKRFRV
jgi:hypothetical protein